MKIPFSYFCLDALDLYDKAMLAYYGQDLILVNSLQQEYQIFLDNLNWSDQEFNTELLNKIDKNWEHE